MGLEDLLASDKEKVQKASSRPAFHYTFFQLDSFARHCPYSQPSTCVVSLITTFLHFHYISNNAAVGTGRFASGRGGIVAVLPDAVQLL
jgi:hypothetical protein